MRGWGKAVTRICGVRVRFTAPAKDALSQRVPRVMTFNHSSTLDVLVGSSLLPDGGVLVLKAEFRKLPLLGSAAAALGSIFLDRGNRKKAYASLEIACERIVRERLQVLMAPEGTRDNEGSMGRFKLGAFHLAHASGAKILPIVMHGHAACWPRGQFTPSRGTVTVDVLPEYTLTDGTPEGLRVAADALREAYIAALSSPPTV